VNRYGVHSVTGYSVPLGGAGGRTGDGKLVTLWYIHDRAFNCNVVAVIRRGAGGEEQARDHAFRLNAEERAWEKGKTLTADPKKKRFGHAWSEWKRRWLR
jgi:hypothetical protein